MKYRWLIDQIDKVQLATRTAKIWSARDAVLTARDVTLTAHDVALTACDVPAKIRLLLQEYLATERYSHRHLLPRQYL